MRRSLTALALLLPSLAMPAIDVLPLWDFSKPELSEQRFRERLAGASEDDAAILTTQIARSHGLRRNFDEARRILATLEPTLAQRSPEAQVRYHLELGRSHVSATHRPAELTPQAREQARAAYARALELARAARLDYLEVDTLHMLPFVETEEAKVLAANQAALAAVLASQSSEARKWEGALRHNTGYSLHQLGRHEEALAMFRSNVELGQRTGAPAAKQRIAHWMVAWTLRALRRHEEALAIQLRLEQENVAAGAPDEYVFEELAHLYRALGQEERQRHYEALHRAAQAQARK